MIARCLYRFAVGITVFAWYALCFRMPAAAPVDFTMLYPWVETWSTLVDSLPYRTALTMAVLNAGYVMVRIK